MDSDAPPDATPGLDDPFASAIAQAAAVRARKVSARELLEAHIARMARHNPALNAIVWTRLDAARAEADAADAAAARGDSLGPLHGVAMTVKESFDVAGAPTTWGIPALRDNIAAADSDSVARLKAAGAIIFGKTNVPINLADWQSYNDIYGVTNNPWDLARTPGGSSGGSAAALATGMAALEIGSDIGASIRNPAHYCGVFGHKPTMELCSTRGQALPGMYQPPDIAVVGPLARSAADLELALDVMAGGDPIHQRGWRVALPPPRRAAIRDFRIAVVTDDANARVDDEVQDAIRALAERLARDGATVSFDARPEVDFDQAWRDYVTLLRATTSGGLSDDAFAAARAEADALDPADMSYNAIMLRAQTMRHRDWLAVSNRRHRMRLAWDAFFRDWDVMLAPTAASTAFLHNHVGARHTRMIPVNGVEVPVTDQLFWAGLFGMAFLPGTVAPIGLGARSGLPIGVQIVAGAFEDRTSLAFARLIEQAYGGFAPPPGYG